MHLVLFLVTLLFTTLHLPHSTRSEFYTTQPFSTTVFRADTPSIITCRDGGRLPALATVPFARLELCTGSDIAQACPLVLAQRVNPRAGRLSVVIPGGVGPSGAIWFLRWTMPNGQMNWSTRFTLVGAHGRPVPLPPPGNGTRNGTSAVNGTGNGTGNGTAGNGTAGNGTAGNVTTTVPTLTGATPPANPKSGALRLVSGSKIGWTVLVAMAAVVMV